MNTIDGKSVANNLKNDIKNELIKLKKLSITPGLAVVLMGENQASATYVKMKEKACLEVGIASFVYKLEQNQSQNELLELIEKLNKDEKIHGILVQLPLPNHIDTNAILETIDPKKDVDGFCAVNAGSLSQNRPFFVPCTPLGIIELLNAYNVNLQGIHACVVGVSNIVGKPMIDLLLNHRATVVCTHSKTKNLSEFTKNADLLIVAVGKTNFITADMVKEGAIVIDVGINRDCGKLRGDVDFNNVAPKCHLITPVPGGVGPMTIAMLLQNTLKAAKNLHKVN